MENDKEQALQTLEPPEEVSGTELTETVSTTDSETVSDQEAGETEGTEVTIDFNNPKIKAAIEREAQRFNDKKYNTKIEQLLKDQATKEQELANIRKQQEELSQTETRAANFEAKLSAAKRKLEENGASEDYVQSFLDERRKEFKDFEEKGKVWTTHVQEYREFLGEKLQLKAQKLAVEYELDEKDAESLEKSAKDISKKNADSETMERELKYLALEKWKEKTTKKAVLKEKTPKPPADSGHKSGGGGDYAKVRFDGDAPSASEMIQMGLKKKK
jgi:hypothetical protein